MTDDQATDEAARHGWTAVRRDGWFYLFPVGAGFVGRGESWEIAFSNAERATREAVVKRAEVERRVRNTTPAMF